MSYFQKILNKNINRSYQPCKAAEKSIRFGPAGHIMVCCHNNRDIIGVFPWDNIAEIWKGKKAVSLRKILSDKFAGGCDYCRYESRSKLSFRSAGLYDRYEAQKDSPVILDFKADSRCNLSCVMCSGMSSTSLVSNKKPLRANPYDTPEFINQLKGLIPGIKEARFSGGEPFLSGLYYQIWDAIIELNPECNIVVQTNGTILNEHIKELLKRGKFNINISIDSFEKSTYEKIRIGASYEKVIQNIEFFREYCLSQQRFFGMTACAMKENISEFENIINQWNKYQAYGWFSVVWFPPKNAIWTLNENKISEIINSLDNIKIPDNVGHEKNNINAALVLKSMLHQQRELSILHHGRQHGMPAKDFEALLLSYCPESLKGNDVYKSVAQKLHRYFIRQSGCVFNENSFLKIRNFTSDEYFIEILDLTGDEAIADLLDTFKISC